MTDCAFLSADEPAMPVQQAKAHSCRSIQWAKCFDASDSVSPWKIYLDKRWDPFAIESPSVFRA